MRKEKRRKRKGKEKNARIAGKKFGKILLKKKTKKMPEKRQKNISVNLQRSERFRICPEIAFFVLSELIFPQRYLCS